MAYYLLGKEEEALKVIKEGVRFYPGSVELLEKKGSTLLKINGKLIGSC